MVVFDHDGNLTGVTQQELPTPRQLLEAGDLAAVYEDNYEDFLRRELSVTSGVIRIKAFCLPEEELAVYELPESSHDFQDNPDNPDLSDEERRGLIEFFREWKAHGQFVLVWQDDFWLDGNGEVVAT